MKKEDKINQYLLLIFLVTLTVLVVLVVIRVNMLTTGSWNLFKSISGTNINYETLEEFKLDNEQKYKVTTDKTILTYDANGAYTNIYYAIDLENKKVTEVEENYTGSEYSYKDKINYVKELSDDEVKNLKDVLENMKKSPENPIPYDVDSEEGTYYILTSKDGDSKIYNLALINDFKEIVKQ